jgi:hypothetical protein
LNDRSWPLPVRTRRVVGARCETSESTVRCPPRDASIPANECMSCGDSLGAVSSSTGTYLRCTHPAAQHAALVDVMREPLFSSVADRTPLSDVMTGDVVCVGPDLGLRGRPSHPGRVGRWTGGGHRLLARYRPLAGRERRVHRAWLDCSGADGRRRRPVTTRCPRGTSPGHRAGHRLRRLPHGLRTIRASGREYAAGACSIPRPRGTDAGQPQDPGRR